MSHDVARVSCPSKALLDLGCVLLGKTALHEIGLGITGGHSKNYE
jgi:hypothetical protein